MTNKILVLIEEGNKLSKIGNHIEYKNQITDKCREEKKKMSNRNF